jgi:hypothetical protein
MKRGGTDWEKLLACSHVRANDALFGGTPFAWNRCLRQGLSVTQSKPRGGSLTIAPQARMSRFVVAISRRLLVVLCFKRGFIEMGIGRNRIASSESCRKGGSLECELSAARPLHTRASRPGLQKGWAAT